MNDYIIPIDVLEAAAMYIKEEADVHGYFCKEFEIEDADGYPVHFHISCELINEKDFYSNGQKYVGVRFFACFAETLNDEGFNITNDFSKEDFQNYILN